MNCIYRSLLHGRLDQIDDPLDHFSSTYEDQKSNHHFYTESCQTRQKILKILLVSIHHTLQRISHILYFLFQISVLLFQDSDRLQPRSLCP